MNSMLYHLPLLKCICIPIIIAQLIIEVIQNAKREIYMEVWSQDFKFFEKELLNAYNRNVEIRIVGYDNFNSRFGMVFQHAFARDIELSLGGRMVIIAVDDSEGVVGKISSLKNDISDTNIIWTKNTGIVFVIKEFIVHDMYLIDVEENLVEQMKYIYGKGFKRLKDKVLGANATYMIHQLLGRKSNLCSRINDVIVNFY